MNNSALEIPSSTAINTKFTAPQIETNCPARLQQIGREIKERLEKARKQHQQAENHLVAVNELIAEAEKLCDGGGFKKFREVFCPELGKSQAYVLHAIATGKKKIEHHKAEQRDRQRKSRAKRKSQSDNSVTVTERSSSERLEVLPGGTETSSIGTRPDRSLFAFSVQVVELAQKIKNRAPARFVGTIASAETLNELSKFLSELADLKRSAAADPAPTASASENAVATPLTCSPEQVHQYDHTSK